MGTPLTRTVTIVDTEDTVDVFRIEARAGRVLLTVRDGEPQDLSVRDVQALAAALMDASYVARGYRAVDVERAAS